MPKRPLPAGLRPDRPVEIANRLNSAAIHLLRRISRDDGADGVTGARLSALSVLVYGGPQTVSVLARREGVATPTMTRIVDALVRDGLVDAHRGRRPTGARCASTVTEDGRRLHGAGAGAADRAPGRRGRRPAAQAAEGPRARARDPREPSRSSEPERPDDRDPVRPVHDRPDPRPRPRRGGVDGLLPRRLGLPFLFAFPHMAFFDADGVRLYLAEPERADFRRPGDPLLQGARHRGGRGRARGARRRLRRAAARGPSRPAYDLWMAFTKDPDGNNIGLMSEVPTATTRLTCRGAMPGLSRPSRAAGCPPAAPPGTPAPGRSS